MRSELLESPKLTITNAFGGHPGQFCTSTNTGIHVSGMSAPFHVVKLISKLEAIVRLDGKHDRLVIRRAGFGARRIHLRNDPETELVVSYPFDPREATEVSRDGLTLANFFRLRTRIGINLDECSPTEMIIVLALIGSGLSRRTTGRPGIAIPL